MYDLLPRRRVSASASVQSRRGDSGFTLWDPKWDPTHSRCGVLPWYRVVSWNLASHLAFYRYKHTALLLRPHLRGEDLVALDDQVRHVDRVSHHNAVGRRVFKDPVRRSTRYMRSVMTFHDPIRTLETHPGFLNRWILGLSASWNNSRSSAASIVSFKCFSFLSVHVSALGVIRAKIREKSGSEAAVVVVYSGSVEGDVARLGGAGKVL